MGTGSEASLAGYLKRIAPQASWFTGIAALAAILSDLPRVPGLFGSPAAFVQFAISMLVIGTVAGILREAWN